MLDTLADAAHLSSSVFDTRETLVAATHHGHAPLAAHFPSCVWLLLGHLKLLPGELCLWTDAEAHVAGEILNVGELKVCHVLCPLVPDEAVAGRQGDTAVWLDNVVEGVTCLGETENIVKVQKGSNVEHDVCWECFQSLAFSTRRLCAEGQGLSNLVLARTLIEKIALALGRLCLVSTAVVTKVVLYVSCPVPDTLAVLVMFQLARAVKTEAILPGILAKPSRTSKLLLWIEAKALVAGKKLLSNLSKVTILVLAKVGDFRPGEDGDGVKDLVEEAVRRGEADYSWVVELLCYFKVNVKGQVSEPEGVVGVHLGLGCQVWRLKSK